MPVISIYASLLAFFFVVLSLRVIGVRRIARVALGDGGDATLMRRMRVHANFAEYVPLALLLLALAESQGSPGWALHALGLVLIAGRAMHAYGVGRAPEAPYCRVVGMAMTFAVLLSAGGLNLVLAAAIGR
jgi:uncharacterized membrane protein YecN with MAPEG domain